MHAHTHAITLTPAREGGFEEDVGAQDAPGAVSGAKQPSRWRLPRVPKAQAGGPSSPRSLPSRASCCEGQGPSSLRPEKQRHWRAPAPRDCRHTAPAPGPFTPRKRVADLCPAGLPPLSPKGRRALLAEGHQADGEEPSFQTVALGSRLIPTIHQLWHLSEPQSLHLH